MREATKLAFAKVVADDEARARAAAVEQDRRAGEREQFEAACQRVRDAIIIPALEEVAHEILEPAGWICRVHKSDARTMASLEIHRGAMMSLGGRERPRIDFTINADVPRLDIHAASLSQGGPEGSHPLGDITADFVHKKVLQLFQRLATGR
jgi:hypothetical protein